MATERVEEIISKEALDSVDALTEKVNTATSSFEKLIEEAVQFNKIFGASTNLKEFTDATKKLQTSQQDLDKSQKQLADTQAKLAAAQSDTAKETAKYQVQLQEQTKANKDAARETLGLNDAYKQLEQQAAAAEKSAKSLAATYGVNSKEAADATTKSKALNEQLKAIDASIGKNQRNVGNYSESFSILEQELTRVTTKINTLNTAQRDGAAGFNVGPRGIPDAGARAAGGDDIKQLTIQQQALQQVVSNTTRGFTSLTQELRTNERGLQTLRAAGLEDTTAFKSLQTQTDNSRRSFNEFAAQQKILSSQAPALTALTVAAKGLAGAYALGAGASALFGDEEGKIDKEVQKLVAVMTILQGLQEVHNLLMEKNAIATALAAAAQKAYAFVVGESTGALAAFKVALAATGIGLFIIALGYVVSNFNELFKATDPVVDAIDKLGNTTQQAKNALKAYGDTAEKITKGVLKDLHDQTKALNDQLGLTPTPLENATNHIAAMQQAIKDLTEEQKKLGDVPTPFETGEDTAEKISKIKDQIAGLNVAVGDYLNKIKAVETHNIADAFGQGALEAFKLAQDLNNRQLAEQKTGLDKRIQLIDSNYKLEKIIIETTLSQELEAANGSRDKEIEANTKYHNSLETAERNHQETISKTKKEYADRDSKAAADIIERDINTRIAAEKKIADDESELPERRIAALRNELRDENLLLAEQEAQELKVKGLTDEEKKNIDDKYNAQRLLAETEISIAIFKQRVALVGQEKDLIKDLSATTIAELSKITDYLVKLPGTINNANFNEFAKLITDGVEKADAELKKLAFTGDATGKVLSDIFSIQKGQTIDQYVAQIELLKKNLGELGQQIESGIFDLQTDALEKQKNLIQDQIDLINQRRDTDIAAISASSKSEQDKANAIAVINATADAKQREAERRQKDIDRKKAQIEKQESITRLVQSTAEAVLAALGEKPYKQTNIANAALIGAIGLAQIAKIVAQPIPQYETGTMSHPGGEALVHPGELMVTPDGRLTMTPKLPTVMNLPAETIVYPDAQKALADYYGGITVEKFNNLDNDNKNIELGLKRIESAVKNKQETHWHQHNTGWEKMTSNEGNTQRWLKQNIS